MVRPGYGDNITLDPCFLLSQTLKALRQVEMINFGDCLVRSKGVIAITDAVCGDLLKLKVLMFSCPLFLRDSCLRVVNTKESGPQLGLSLLNFV